MLGEIDTLVIDLQDVGVRCYTYIRLADKLDEINYRQDLEKIRPCFEAGLEVVVLDRPNPLGGIKIAGPPIDKSCMSYVGAFQVPFDNDKWYDHS